MYSEGQRIINEHRADKLQHIADGMTQYRYKIARFAGAVLAATLPNWYATGLQISGEMSDLEGQIVKRADKIRGYHKETGGSELDPKADHRWRKSIFTGLFIRALRSRNVGEAAFVGANLVLSAIRDDNMDENREMIHIHELDEEELKANLASKAKMVLQGIGTTIIGSPLAKRPKWHKAGYAFTALGTAAGWIGERIFRRKVSRLIEAKQLREAAS